jgi:transposase InsO family protein
MLGFDIHFKITIPAWFINCNYIDIIISDNGPPFNGDKYVRYMKALGIQAKFSTPYWPQGNATVERFMQRLGKALKTAKVKDDHGDKN